jgi:hypothetical protein
MEGRRAWPTTALRQHAARPGWTSGRQDSRPPTGHPRDGGTAWLKCTVFFFFFVFYRLGGFGERQAARLGSQPVALTRGQAIKPNAAARSGAARVHEGRRRWNAPPPPLHPFAPPLSPSPPSYTLRAATRGKGAVDDPGVIFGLRDALFLPVSPLLLPGRALGHPAPAGRT